MIRPRVLAKLVPLALGLLLALSVAPDARAYTWMIRHGYTGCLPCHADPSGGGALTEYGRAQSEILLGSTFSVLPEEPSRSTGFLWGLVPLPQGVRLGGDVRQAYLATKVDGTSLDRRIISMRADLSGDIEVGRLRVAGSVGYAPEGALNATLTRGPEHNVVSREHWVGVRLDDDGAWLLRAGRIALPFGVRNIEHTLWVRSQTRTDVNDRQQHGVALSLSVGRVRAEAMLVAGNYQIRPDDFRERGYTAYAEWAATDHLALGVSSLFTRAKRDLYYRVTDYRQAHGLFARYSPAQPVVFLAEADWTYQSLTWNGHRAGYAAALQADLEPAQGLHAIFTAETKRDGTDVPPSYGAWCSVAWFFAPHVDARLDEVFQSIGVGSGPRVEAVTALLQLHVFL